MKGWSGFCAAAAFALLFSMASPVAAQDDSADDAQADSVDEAQLAAYRKLIEGINNEVTRQTGEISILGGDARLSIPEGFYFLGPKDARRVLEDGWGNPPDDSVLGMIFPAAMAPMDDYAWGVTIEYSDDGYVSDKEAAKTDYDDLLKQMKKDAEADNKFRKENGYVPIELIGWAEPPHYDQAEHKLYWAKEIRFGEAEINTLNYNIRVLGRKGVLVLNFVAAMNQLDEIRQAAPDVLELASFAEGSRYADYKPGVDKKAAYGIAALIAGGAIAKKTGLLAALLLFGKKFIIVILGGIAAGFAWLKRVLTGR